MIIMNRYLQPSPQMVTSGTQQLMGTKHSLLLHLSLVNDSPLRQSNLPQIVESILAVSKDVCSCRFLHQNMMSSRHSTMSQMPGPS